MPRVNLLPWRETLRREREKQFKLMAVGAVLLGASLVLYAHLMIDGAIEEQVERNAFLKKEKVRLGALAKIKEELEAKRTDLLSRMSIIESLQQSRNASVRLFNEVGTLLPAGLYLTSMAQAESRLRFEGRASSNADVSEFMRRLSKSAVFKDPKLLSIQSDDTDYTVDFRVDTVIQGLELPAEAAPAPAKRPARKARK